MKIAFEKFTLVQNPQNKSLICSKRGQKKSLLFKKEDPFKVKKVPKLGV